MKIKTHDTFVEFTFENNSLKEIISTLKTKISSTYQKNNIAIDLLKNNNFSLEELLLFLPFSDEIRAKKKSFVIINDAINPDDIPDEILVVPTLQEAKDIIEMEEIERELGF